MLGADILKVNTENFNLNSKFQVKQLEERFVVVKLLGQGTAGTVYHVRDKLRNYKDFAVKVLSNPKAFDSNTIGRFIEELKICSKIKHPNIVQAYELIEGQNLIGYTMEYVNGCDLRQLQKNAKFTYPEIDQIMHQLLEGLTELHRLKIMHRDIKLENIILSENGCVKISDLGLVKRIDRQGDSSTDDLLGTPQYMAPEYIKSTWFDERSDIYACGVVLYELLSGKRRLPNKCGEDSIKHLVSTQFEVPRLSVPEKHAKYYDILKYSLAVSPDARFQTAKEMQSAFSVDSTPINMEISKKIHNSKKTGKMKLLLYMWVLIICLVLAISRSFIK